MEIYRHEGSTFFSDKNNNYLERNSSKTIVILDDTFQKEAFNVTVDSLTDILSKDKIYVSKHSSFSPLLLSRIEGIDVSRVISTEKATKILVDESEYYEYRDNIWYGEFVSQIEDQPAIRGIFNDKNDYQMSSLQRIRNPVTGDVIQNTSSYRPVGQCRPCVIINTDFDMATLLLTYPKKIVATEKLEDYINGFLPDLDNEALESCLSMLGSKDMNAVKLGINMLSTFNISSHTIPISLAIRNNLQNLMTVRSLTAFKRICSLCKLSINNIRNVPILDFNIQIYRNSTNPEHKLIVRDSVAKAVENEIRDQFLNYLKEVGLDFAINRT